MSAPKFTTRVWSFPTTNPLPPYTAVPLALLCCLIARRESTLLTYTSESVSLSAGMFKSGCQSSNVESLNLISIEYGCPGSFASLSGTGNAICQSFGISTAPSPPALVHLMSPMPLTRSVVPFLPFRTKASATPSAFSGFALSSNDMRQSQFPDAPLPCEEDPPPCEVVPPPDEEVPPPPDEEAPPPPCVVPPPVSPLPLVPPPWPRISVVLSSLYVCERDFAMETAHGFDSLFEPMCSLLSLPFLAMTSSIPSVIVTLWQEPPYDLPMAGQQRAPTASTFPPEMVIEPMLWPSQEAPIPTAV